MGKILLLKLQFMMELQFMNLLLLMIQLNLMMKLVTLPLPHFFLLRRIKDANPF